MDATTMIEDTVARLRALQTPERIAKSQALSTVWRGYYPLPRDEWLKSELEDLVDGFILTQAEAEAKDEPATGRLGEGRSVVVLGPSGTGKTRALHRVFAGMREFDGYMRRDGTSILLSVVAPSPCRLKLLGHTLLRALGYETARDLRENVVWDLVRHQLRVRNVRFIWIDELQHLFQSAHAGEVQKVLDTLKALMQTPDWPVWLILSGLPQIADVIETDVQIRRRCAILRFLPLSLVEDRKAITSIFSLYSTRAKVRPRQPPEDEFFLRLLHASHGAAGLMIELVQDAVVTAVREKAAEVEPAHFASVYRRRTGCPDDRNVFLVEDWASVDAYRAFGPDGAPIQETQRRPKDDRKSL